MIAELLIRHGCNSGLKLHAYNYNYNFQYEFVNGNGNRTRSNIALYTQHGRRKREWLYMYYGRGTVSSVW